MKTISILFTSIVVACSVIFTNANAEADIDLRGLVNEGGDFSNKAEAREKLDELVSKGKMRAGDADKAREKIQQMNREDFQNMKDEAAKQDNSTKGNLPPSSSVDSAESDVSESTEDEVTYETPEP